MSKKRPRRLRPVLVTHGPRQERDRGPQDGRMYLPSHNLDLVSQRVFYLRTNHGSAEKFLIALKRAQCDWDIIEELPDDKGILRASIVYAWGYQPEIERLLKHPSVVRAEFALSAQLPGYAHANSTHGAKHKSQLRNRYSDAQDELRRAESRQFHSQAREWKKISEQLAARLTDPYTGNENQERREYISKLIQRVQEVPEPKRGGIPRETVLGFLCDCMDTVAPPAVVEIVRLYIGQLHQDSKE